jgi:DNA transformation protein
LQRFGSLISRRLLFDEKFSYARIWLGWYKRVPQSLFCMAGPRAGMEKGDIEEMFSALGPVTVKPMFGGKGVYFKGSILAVEFRGDLLLKADRITAPEFAAAGAVQWAYAGKAGKPVKMPYWSIPPEAFDDPDNMARWLRLAREAGLRSVKPGKNRRAGTG